MKENVIKTKSKRFALRIIKLYKYLMEQGESVLSKQVLRSGTSIGANVCEAEYAQSEADFYAKLYIATKEANESKYWLELLHESGYIDDTAFSSIDADVEEILSILVAITKNQKTNPPDIL